MERTGFTGLKNVLWAGVLAVLGGCSGIPEETPPEVTPTGSQRLESQGATLLRNINAQPPEPFFRASGGMFSLGSTVFFSGYDEATGYELWKLDASGRGVLLKDLNPGQASSGPSYFTAVNGTLFFSTQVAFGGAELWKSAGTTATTVRVKRGVPSAAGGDSVSISDLTHVNGTLLFASSLGDTGHELWRSDGTEAGTVLVKDIRPGPESAHVQGLTELGGSLFFIANDGVHGDELWKSDGTAAGTVLVKDIQPGLAGSRFSTHWNKIPAAGGTLFLLIQGEEGAPAELWKSDGTEAGTVRVKTLSVLDAYESYQGFADVGGVLFFTLGTELWRSDGTAAGTTLLQTLDASPAGLVSYQGALFFLGGEGLWTSDGSLAGTHLVASLPWGGYSGAVRLVEMGGHLYFEVSPLGEAPTLWKSDGSAAGTQKVVDLPLEPGGLSGSLWLWSTGTSLYFGGRTTSEGANLFRSDGTATGTAPVERASPLPRGSALWNVTRVGTGLFFSADDGLHGRELWRTDGTAAGTVLLKDLLPGGASGLQPHGEMVVMNGTLFFLGDDGVHGRELWKTDGTEAGTVLVKDLVPGPGGFNWVELEVSHGRLFFTSSTPATGMELWKTDGTEAGTVLVKDLVPGSGGSFPENLSDVNGTLFFFADDGVHGWELWKTDGTEAGTVLVKDLTPGPESSSFEFLTNVNGTLYFILESGGMSLWRSDGTAAGTVKLKDFGLAGWLQEWGGLLYFAADEGVHGVELWKSDGTSAGTVLLKDLNPGPGSSFPQGFTRVGRGLVFVANDAAHGFEPWGTDGTAAGTVLLKDVQPGPFNGVPLNDDGTTMLAVEERGLAIFAASNGTTGLEPWMTDGTAAGTGPLADVVPGSGSSDPSHLALLGDRLFFEGWDSVYGREPRLLRIDHLGSAFGRAVAQGNTCGMTHQSTPACTFGTAPEHAYTWTAPFSGTFTFSTAGSSFDTVLQVTNLATGTSIGCNDNSAGTLQSSVSVALTQGQRLRIAVDGFGSSCGAHVLHIHPIPSQSLAMWLRADADVTATSAKVTGWEDQSGRGRHAFMSIPNRNPSLVQGALNGLPVVRFSGAHSLYFPETLKFSTWTIFAVVKNNHPSEAVHLILGPASTSPNHQFRFDNGTRIRHIGIENGMSEIPTIVGDTRVYHALTSRYDGTTLNVLRDGNVMGTHPVTLSATWDLLQIGAWYSSYYLRGDIAELIVYDRAVTESERLRVNAYLRARYALP